MPSEADTRAKLIDPAIHSRGWTEDLIRREETAGAIELIDGKPRKRSRGRIDYLLRIRVNPDTQPVAVALIEAKAEQFRGLKAIQSIERANGGIRVSLHEFTEPELKRIAADVKVSCHLFT